MADQQASYRDPSWLRDRLRLYLVTDESVLKGRALFDVVMQAARAGISCVQLREKNLPLNDFLAKANRLMQLLEPLGIPLVINDNIDIALACKAHGVHLGQSDMPVHKARELLPAHVFLGLSVENMEDLRRAKSMDVDYLGISPVFATPTKTDTGTPWGLQGLCAARSATELPLVAIGGINASNAADVVAAGANGLAVVSAILGAEDPAQAAKELAEKIARVQHYHRVVHYPRVLSIAGSDSGGGAGIQADLKTISALGCFGMTAITAITAQNTTGVRSIHSIPEKILADQIDAVLQDIGVDAVKIGMLHSVSTIDTVANAIERHGLKNVVLDPVMIATSGANLIEPEAVQKIIDRLFDKVALVTPNLDEAGLLTGTRPSNEQDMQDAAEKLLKLNARAVLIKGGHLAGDTVSDLLMLSDGQTFWMRDKRIPTRNSHGTGCTLSSAIASYLALGFSLPDAVMQARTYVRNALEHGAHVQTGSGSGPLNHAFDPQRMHLLRS